MQMVELEEMTMIPPKSSSNHQQIHKPANHYIESLAIHLISNTSHISIITTIPLITILLSLKYPSWDSTWGLDLAQRILNNTLHYHYLICAVIDSILQSMELPSLDDNGGDENAGDGGEENESRRRRDANNV